MKKKNQWWEDCSEVFSPSGWFMNPIERRRKKKKKNKTNQMVDVEDFSEG